MTVEKPNNGGPAFPLAPGTDPESAVGTGATWLDVCAWNAMSGILGNAHVFTCREGMHPSKLAKLAYDYAERMLAEKRWREGGSK